MKTVPYFDTVDPYFIRYWSVVDDDGRTVLASGIATQQDAEDRMVGIARDRRNAVVRSTFEDDDYSDVGQIERDGGDPWRD